MSYSEQFISSYSLKHYVADAKRLFIVCKDGKPIHYIEFKDGDLETYNKQREHIKKLYDI